MKRLTISVHACTDTLALLVAMAWADGTLDDQEKDGIRDAAQTLNLPKEVRSQLEGFMEEAPPLDELKLGSMGVREREFALVASAWMAWISEGIVDDEQALLNDIAAELDIPQDRQDELQEIATGLSRPPSGESWATGIRELFKAIATKVDPGSEDIEIS